MNEAGGDEGGGVEQMRRPRWLRTAKPTILPSKVRFASARATAITAEGSLSSDSPLAASASLEG